MLRFALSLLFILSTVVVPAAEATSVRGHIREAVTGKPIAARIMIQSADGRWFFARSADPQGLATTLDRERSKTSVEKHTCLTAHPFVADLPPGRYSLTVERGKEYFTETKEITVGEQPVDVTIHLRRWINMADRGWFSGDTHVHRPVSELIAPMLAEDVNVVLPMTQWVQASHTSPLTGNKSGVNSVSTDLIAADATHVIYPLNTEYEIFSVSRKPHTLGAVLIINHQKPFDRGVPPVKPIAEEAHRQRALLDLEKHSWPWSMMIVPVMNVDLFELSNNHLWQTDFAFKSWTIDAKPQYGNIETDKDGFTEWGWTEFGFRNWYTLLNCGYRLRPTAGTAFGVHPVPLGFGRVYVHLSNGFRYEDWMNGLNAGQSFVTTGPMLDVRFNGELPGHRFKPKAESSSCEVRGRIESELPLDRIELIINGETLPASMPPKNEPRPEGGFVSTISETVTLNGTSWIAVRAFEKRPQSRFRFAHSNAVYFDVPTQPLRPKADELKYLISRMEQELIRNKGVLSEEELAEYETALSIYRKLSSPADGK